MDALNRSGVAPDALQMIDGTVIRAHHQAAGAKAGRRDRGFGRSRVGERGFKKPKHARRVAIRSDKTADGFLGFLNTKTIRHRLRQPST